MKGQTGRSAAHEHYEFCGLTHSALTLEYPNLLISRSFSKAFGLAALRCGYVLTDPRNIEFLNRIRVGKNLSVPAQAGALAALRDYGSIQTYVQTVRANMGVLTGALRKLRIKALTTPANFVMVKVGHPDEVIRFLSGHNIYVRNRSSLPQLAGFVRITVGDDTATERVILAFRKMPSEYYLLPRTNRAVDLTIKRGARLTLKRGPEVTDSVTRKFERISVEEIAQDLTSDRSAIIRSESNY